MKVLFVDDHPIVVSGFKSLIEGHGWDVPMEVVEAQCAESAERVFAAQKVDVCVLDVNLPGKSGFALARSLLAADPAARLIMFSMNDDPVFIAQAMDAGAAGYVSKNDNPMRMLEAILAVASGQTAWPCGSAERVAHLSEGRMGTGPSLTTRDLEILRQLAKGKSLSEIADAVGVSYKTVALSCSGLRSKLSARTQAELVAIAVERKLV